MVVCVLHPRLALVAALGDRRALLAEPVALAPEPGAPAYVGQTSAAAEAFGIVAGIRVGEALARCPDLRLVPPDPQGVRELWSAVLDALEGIGAAPESDRPGEAYFDADGLEGIHRGSLDGVLAAVRRVLGRGMRVAAAPSRFASYVAATLARPRKAPPVVPATAARAFLAPRPVELLRVRPELVTLADVLDRLGIRTLGELAELPSAAVSERFGHPGLLALDLARGGDTPLQPRRPAEPVAERLELPEAALGPQLERALELLIGRVLARSERRGRSLRALAISARFVERGTWRTSVTLRSASADPERIRLALSTKLGELPAPAATLGLEVESFGPPAHDQGRLIDEQDAVRRSRLGEAVHQARQAAGDIAAMKVMEVDPGSRVPERRAVLAPYPAEEPRDR
ncbi:MAG: DNA polymerase Y family protein [Thermoleophilaceae bacterium]|nr:DNA polymerase Y family protein [Thermoleophilaceae bacterium]